MSEREGPSGREGRKEGRTRQPAPLLAVASSPLPSKEVMAILDSSPAASSVIMTALSVSLGTSQWPDVRVGGQRAERVW